MSLFAVPGWSVDSAAVSGNSSQHTSKKRKRPPGSDHLTADTKTRAVEVNLEKLVQKLKDGSSGDGDSKRRKVVDKKGKTAANKLDKDQVRPNNPKKKTTISKTVATSAVSSSQSTDGLTSMQKIMREKLDGARFRVINETLYKSDSGEAHQMMQADPKVYEEYHVGFRHQVQSWPTNPVLHYIDILSEYPEKTVIADLGCGDAALARSLIPKGMTVLSFDLVSDGEFVVVADACTKIPLPGSEGKMTEKTEGSGQIVDVVVCSLSLMGTNWTNCIREAWRILKPEGQLKIAEVASRFSDIDEFTALILSIGFRLKHKDLTNTHFTLFEFVKIPRKQKNDKEWSNVVSRGSILKACEYKRR